MENQSSINRESWIETGTIIFHPAVLIPFILGFGSLYFIFQTEDQYWKMVLTAVSTIGIGIGVNYFSFFFKDNTKYNKLMSQMNQKEINEVKMVSKITTVCRLLDSMITKIKNHAQGGNGRDLNAFEKQQISDIGVILDNFSEFYSSNYEPYISDIKRVRFERDNAQNEEAKNRLTFICNTYDYILTERKVKEYLDATGSLNLTDARYIQPEGNRFGGSGTPEPTFKQDS